jgi:hypothetical protein
MTKEDYWLVVELVSRLQPILPVGWIVEPSPSGRGVTLTGGVTAEVTDVVTQRSSLMPQVRWQGDKVNTGESVASAVSGVLTIIEHEITHETGEDWPSPGAHSFVSVRDRHIHFGWGDEQHPDVSFAPIELPAEISTQ